MKFIDYYNESDMLNESLLGTVAGGLLFASILRQLSLGNIPVYITNRSNVMPASRSAYQKLMDKFAVSYTDFLSAKKAGTNDLIDRITGKKVRRNKMRDYKEKYNGAIVKKAYKGILKSDGGKIGNPDDIKTVMVYRTNNGGNIVFINTEERGLDRYFVMMDDAAERFFIKYEGSTISSYISKYNDRNYKSPGAFGSQNVDKMVKDFEDFDDREEAEIAKERKTLRYYDDYIARDKAREMRDTKRSENAPSEDEEFDARVMKHYKELIAKKVAKDYAQTWAIELAKKEMGQSPVSDEEEYPEDAYDANKKYRIVLDQKKMSIIEKNIDYLRNKKGGIRFQTTAVGNLKGQRGKIYTFKNGSIVRLYYDLDSDENRMDFLGDGAVATAKEAGFFDIKDAEIDITKVKQIQ